MTSEKPKEDYYREAAQYLNIGERVGAESGEGVSVTLAFLTRGAFRICVIIILPLMRRYCQVSSSSQRGRWKMP